MALRQHDDLTTERKRSGVESFVSRGHFRGPVVDGRLRQRAADIGRAADWWRSLSFDSRRVSIGLGRSTGRMV